MDPVTGAIISLSFLLLFRSIIAWSIFVAASLLGIFVAYQADKFWIAVVVVVLAWLAAAWWQVWAIVQMIHNIVAVIQVL